MQVAGADAVGYSARILTTVFTIKSAQLRYTLADLFNGVIPIDLCLAGSLSGEDDIASVLVNCAGASRAGGWTHLGLIWAQQAICSKGALPNIASIGLHEAFGITHIGTYPAVGFKHRQWHDVGYWRKPLHQATPPTEIVAFSKVREHLELLVHWGTP